MKMGILNNIVALTMPKVKKELSSIFILGTVLILALSIAAPAQAAGIIHRGIFELEGDALDSNAFSVAPDDWNTLFPVDNSPFEKAKVFVDDRPSSRTVSGDTTFFTSGGSKDINDVSQWGRTTNNIAPDKNEITNAYAAAYKDSNGHTILYFGLDRFDNSGDAQVGFWFFQNPIGLTSTGFSGVHKVGDILVLSHFTQGGSVDSIHVYKWVGSGGSDGALDHVVTAAECGPDSNTNVCAIVNKIATTAPWPYIAKDGSTTSFPISTFYEGTIDLTNLIPDAGCFSSFLAETRSSQSLNAQLKDFALGQFNLCHVAVDKSGDTLSKAGDDVNYKFTITNDGALTLYLKSVIDTLLSDLTATANTNGCGTLTPDASCSFTAVRTVLPTDPDPLPNTVTVDYRGTASLTGTAVTASDDHSVDLVHPGITVTKTADNTISKVGDTVTYTIKVTNTGDVALNKNSVSDSLLGDISASFAGTLAVGASETKTFDYTVKAGDADPLVNTVAVHYGITGLPNDITNSASATVDLVHPGIKVEKTADNTISKVGDTVTYTIKVTNTGDIALNKVSVSDSLLGDISASFGGTLDVGASETKTFDYTVKAGDADPLVNTVTVHYGVTSLPNDITNTASASVDLVHPSIKVEKTADNTISKVGDTLTYTIKICNTGDIDLNKVSVGDSLIGDISAFFGNTLPVGPCETKTFDYTVKPGDTDPLVNTVTVHYGITGLPNDITNTASASVDLVHPDMTLAKTANPTSGSVGTVITYTMVITNIGDVQLNRVSVTDTLMGDISNDFPPTLAAGATATIVKTRSIQVGDTSPVVNTVTSVYQVNGLPNKLTREASASVTIPNEGCTPGFWKNHLSLWDQSTDPVSANLAAAASSLGYGGDGTTNALFKDTFGLTDAQMNAAGLTPSLTMVQAINLGGGGFEKLARHGVAGALSAASGINYPFSTTDVLTKVHNAVIALAPEPTATDLANANNLQCPLS